MTRASRLRLGASAVAILAVIGTTAMAQDTTEVVTVTGFRASLEKAMDLKRTALGATDSILAEDIAKFPDLNVTESLQRIPGVNITRESGEGREITVRGLGAQFTRVRINGMEALATAGGQDVNTSTGNSGSNRGRNFDFNVFASELFQQLTVRKSTSADVEEGSLGATVDLHTAHPFDHPGFVFSAAGQMGYQTLAQSANPRVSALISDTFMGGRLGILVSGAYGITNTLEEGSSNIRMQSNLVAGTTITTAAQYGSVNGVSLSTDSNFIAANALYHPRSPRYDYMTVKDKRLGLTGSVQWQPDDATLFSLDAVFADFYQERQEYYFEAFGLSASNVTSATKYPLVSTGTICKFAGESCATAAFNVVSLGLGSAKLQNFDPTDVNTSETVLARAELTNVGLRSEHRLDHLDTRFMEVTLDGSHSFSETFKVHALGGWSESHHRNPIQTTITADYGCKNPGAVTTCPAGGAGTAGSPFVYDYTGGDMPYISYGAMYTTQPISGWWLSQVRERANYTFNSFRTAVADFEWSPTNEIKIEGGVDFRNYGYRTQSLRRSNGTNATQDTNIPLALQNADLTQYYQKVSLKGISVPAQNGVAASTNWWSPSITAFNSTFTIFDQTVDKFTNSFAGGACVSSTVATDASNCGAFHMAPEPDIGNNGEVTENDYGGWLQANWDTKVLDMPFRGNIGGRFILTETMSHGYSYGGAVLGIISGAPLHGTYHDFLPSANLVLQPIPQYEDLLVRFNASFAMTRPSLTGMLPSGSPSVSGGSITYSVGNPKLTPNRSKNLDLAFEWYYGKGSMLSIAGFWKHLDNITVTQSQTLVLDPANAPALLAQLGLADAGAFAGACGLTLAQWNNGDFSASCNVAGHAYNTPFKYSKPTNAKGSPLYGAEINWQQQLSFLPEPFDSMGILGNFTYVQAQQNFPAAVAGTTYKADLRGMSRVSYNGTLYYDDSVFQARVTGAFRSHFLFDETVNTNNNGVFSKATFNLDASASYKINENLMITLDALNLTNQGMDVYTDGTFKRPYEYHETGRVIFAGVKFNY